MILDVLYILLCAKATDELVLRKATRDRLERAIAAFADSCRTLASVSLESLADRETQRGLAAITGFYLTLFCFPLAFAANSGWTLDPAPIVNLRCVLALGLCSVCCFAYRSSPIASAVRQLFGERPSYVRLVGAATSCGIFASIVLLLVDISTRYALLGSGMFRSFDVTSPDVLVHLLVFFIPDTILSITGAVLLMGFVLVVAPTAFRRVLLGFPEECLRRLVESKSGAVSALIALFAAAFSILRAINP